MQNGALFSNAIIDSMSIYSSKASVNFATGRWVEMSSSSQG